MLKKVSLTISLIFVTLAAFSQNNKQDWIDSVFQTLNTEKKIGQLLMLRVALHSQEEVEDLFYQIRSHHIGGAIVMNGGPCRQVHFANKVQQLSEVPLFLGIEAGLGVGQTLDSILIFPQPLVLAALKNDTLVYQTAKGIAREMKLLGLNLNFSPQANFEPSYSDHLMRFGDHENRVARKANIFVQGLQDNGIIACAQHTISVKQDAPANKIENAEKANKLFYPYQSLIDQGIRAILTTQLPNTYLERHESVPEKIAQIFISETIRKYFGFSGLTFTNVPSLQKKVEKPRRGETELLAFQVGNDVLIDPQNVGSTIKKIRKALKKNVPLQEQLDASVKKILSAKYDVGLSTPVVLDTDNLLRKLEAPEVTRFRQQVIAESLTLVANHSQTIPIKTLANKRFASVSIGTNNSFAFTQTLSKYTEFNHFSLQNPGDTTTLNVELKNHDFIIVATFHPLSLELVAPWVKNLAVGRQVILTHFGDPLQLKPFEYLPSVIAAYTGSEVAQKTAAQIIFGALPIHGELPLTINEHWPEGTGGSFTTIDRLSYAFPHEAGMDEETLNQIETIAMEAIEAHATPGCQVLVARNGKVIYDRSFGWLTYEKTAPVEDQTIYDLASLTKVSATLQSIMMLKEKGLIDVNKKASLYLSELRNTDKKDITIKDMLTHQSGLFPFLLMYPQTMKGDTLMPHYYNPTRNENYPLQVAPDLFASTSLRDSVWHWILTSKMLERPPRTPHTYRYSDLGLMILHRTIEKIINQPMEDFLKQNLYGPIGAGSLGFLPLNRFPPSQIAPTEKDTVYRKVLVVGTVHDERAAMVGGIAGHAGLFGNANDLAKLYQMLLNGGSYGGIRFYRRETVATFTQKQYENSRRGLGWDKPTISDWNGPTSMMASPKTFGHTGFTGTCIWVDPEFNLVYVFLSNCRFPDRSGKLISENIRSRIQDVIYQSIFNHCQYPNQQSWIKSK